MKARLALLFLIQLALTNVMAQDLYNQIDEMGNVTQRSDNQNFNKHNNDTTRNKEIPKGYYTWNVDRKFGDRIFVEPDTLPHLFMNNFLRAKVSRTVRSGAMHTMNDTLQAWV